MNFNVDNISIWVCLITVIFNLLMMSINIDNTNIILKHGFGAVVGAIFVIALVIMKVVNLKL